jgi:hypothetical protein
VPQAAIKPLVIASVIAALLVILPGGAGSSPFAGYVWSGVVESIRGEWTVPRVAAGSRPGVASTWIGAEAPGGVGAPFIQIGTNEQLLSSSILHERLNGPQPPTFFAFWSDVARHFHPTVLFPVAGGDTISAGMQLGNGKWTLSITDRTTGETANLTSRQETQASFNQAEWTQEDVTDTRTHATFPYPRLTAFSFTRMSVNSQPPSSVDLTAQTLSEHGITVTPSALRNDGFQLVEHGRG